jgi:hypothetical protein
VVLVAGIVKSHKNKAIATIVPLHGNINDPKTSGWQTFLGVLRNAFIQALHERISGDNPDQESSKDKD